MSTTLRSLQRLLKLFENKNIPYMIIGGYALPFYGRIRTTLDLDIAVAIKTEQELNQLIKWLQSIDIEVTGYSPNNPLMIIVDQKEKVETELWLKPDGIVFDQETLRRRRKVKLDTNINAWIISPEDFIVNKLAIPDRGAVDEQDDKKRAHQTSKQTRQRIPNKKSPTSWSARNTAKHTSRLTLSLHYKRIQLCGFDYGFGNFCI